MRFLTGPKVFVTLLAFFAIGVIVTLDPAAVGERHRAEVQARASHYSGQHSSAYAHFQRDSVQAGEEGTLAYYYYPAYRRPVSGAAGAMTAQDAGRIMEIAPTAAGESAKAMEQASINQLKVQMYEHASKLEYEEAAKLRDQIRAMEGGQ